MPKKPWDYEVAVIGGGPGGSTAAAYARKRGLSVLLIEKEEFPRFHIGESLLPKGNEILRETGAWDRIASAGFIHKFGAAFFLANGTARTEIQFSDSLVKGLDFAFQVERAKFDSILLDHARDLGTEVRLKTTARSAKTVDGVHHIVIQDGQGERTVTARWVLDASGRDHLFSAGQNKTLKSSPFPKRVAIFNHFRGVARAPGRAAGHTLAIRLDNGWFWLIPIDEERTSVGLVTTVEAMRASGLKPDAIFREAVAGSAKLTELFEGATPTMEYRVTSDYSYFRREIAGERMLQVGDAAGFFDPIFSSGVYMSMLSAKLAVELVARAHAENRPLTRREGRRYGAAVKKHAGVFQKLISVFYNNDSFAVFMCSSVPWGIRPAICSIVAGHARMIWPIYWRFRVFLAVCWLQQRRVPVFSKLDYDQGGLGRAPRRIPA